MSMWLGDDNNFAGILGIQDLLCKQLLQQTINIYIHRSNFLQSEEEENLKWRNSTKNVVMLSLQLWYCDVLVCSPLVPRKAPGYLIGVKSLCDSKMEDRMVLDVNINP